jgi:hypothetical protein
LEAGRGVRLLLVDVEEYERVPDRESERYGLRERFIPRCSSVPLTAFSERSACGIIPPRGNPRPRPLAIIIAFGADGAPGTTGLSVTSLAA